MNIDLNNLFEEVIRKAFEYHGTPLTDEQIEEIQIKLASDSEFAEYVKNCISFDGIAIERYRL